MVNLVEPSGPTRRLQISAVTGKGGTGYDTFTTQPAPTGDAYSGICEMGIVER